TVPRRPSLDKHSRRKAPRAADRESLKERFRHKEKRSTAPALQSSCARRKPVFSLLLTTLQARAGVCGHRWKSLRVIPLVAGYLGPVRLGRPASSIGGVVVGSASPCAL